MRKLASIERIEAITPIEGADLICLVTVRGWQCVALKSEFKQGDLCVYLEVDSFLPVLPRYEFLAKGSAPKKMIVDGEERLGYRLRTARKLGQLSQGLAMPLRLFPEVPTPAAGQDVTGPLGIRLYEMPVPACLCGEVRGPFPSFVPKTDEERVQNLLEALSGYQGKSFYASVKLDGSSMTCFRYQDDFGVCSRGWDLKESDTNSFWKVANRYELKTKLPDGYALQGECVGEGINDNRHKLKGQDVYVFYVYELAKGRYLELEEMNDFCARLGLRTVPILQCDLVLEHSLEVLLKLADGPCPLNPLVLREGIVLRMKGVPRKVSFKVLSNEYLLKYGL